VGNSPQSSKEGAEMPVQIGAKVHDFSDPTGLLSDCHRRIEMFLGSLESVAKMIDRPFTEEAGRMLDLALHYFRESAPKHNTDEEESLFPRMRRIQDPRIESALAKLEGLEKDHRRAAPLHAEVDRLGRIFLSRRKLSETEVAGFRRAISDLAAMYREHIRVEDEAVFPAAAMLLPDEDRAAIGREMAARREIQFSGEDRPQT
jgi:hemerythrin-like domain-containing protein